MSGHGTSVCLGFALFVSIGIYGCPSPEAFNAAMDTEMLAGGNDQRLVFTRMDAPDFPAIDPLAFLIDPEKAAAALGELSNEYLPAFQTVVVDVASLQVSPLTEVLPNGYAFPLTDGDWLAWQDLETGIVHTYHLATGQKGEISTDLQDGNGYLSQLKDGKLLIELGPGGQMLLLLVDVATGEQTLIGGNVSPGRAMLGEDALLLQYYPALPGMTDAPTELENVSIEEALRTNIDLFDLATGQSRTLVTGIQRGQLTGFVGGKIAWTETSADGATTTIKLYDPNTGQTQDLYQFTSVSTPEESTSINAAGEMGVLFGLYSNSEEGMTMRQVWELHRPDGSKDTILDSTQTFRPFDFTSIPPVYAMPTIVGKLIVYQDPGTRDWILYDPATQTRRSVNPFE